MGTWGMQGQRRVPLPPNITDTGLLVHYDGAYVHLTEASRDLQASLACTDFTANLG